MFSTVRKAVTLIGWPFATVETQVEEEAFPLVMPEEGDRSERFSVGSYYAAFEMPGYREEMQAQLAERGYELTEPPQGGGGGLLVTRGKVVIDSSGAGAGGLDDNERSYGYGQGSLNLGYIVAQSRWFRIYPLLGVGGGGGGGAIEAETDEAGELSAAEQPAERPGYGMFNAGIGVDVTLRFWRLSLFAGLRVGVGVQVGQAKAIVPTPFLRVITGSSLHV